MPELPEVETVRSELNKQLASLKIIDVNFFYDKIIKTPSKDEVIKLLKGKTIISVDRIAKHLIFNLGDYVLISHLRMEGKYFIVDSYDDFDLDKKHILFEMKLSNNKILIYHDTRKFGTLHLLPTKDYLNLRPIVSVGPEAWTISENQLYEKLQKTNRKIKTVLLDQTIISGLGNIYVDEVLFDCKIHPERLSSSITKSETKLIVNSSKKMLTKAVELKGTTISTFSYNKNEGGGFQKHLKVYSKNNQECSRCKTPISKIKVNGRGTHFCKTCQKNK